MNLRLLKYELSKNGIFKFISIRIKTNKMYLIIKIIELLIIFLFIPIAMALIFFKYRQVKIYSQRIGHQIIEYLYCLNYKNKYNLFVLSELNSANFYIYEYYQIKVVHGKLNKIILNYIFIWPWLNIDVERLIRINEKNIYSENFFNIHKFQLNLNNKILKNKLLEDLDINSNKYICLHVRNSGYSPSDDDRFIYRNGDHDNFNLTIKYLKKLNYKIVIVGHKNKFINPDIINYANSSFKNLKNDILLISGCDYFIGNTSGLHLLAWVFNVKVLLVNIIPYCSTPYFDDILYIRKDLIFNKLLNDYDLNIIDNAFHDDIYKEHGVDYIENSNEKILKFIKENIY